MFRNGPGVVGNVIHRFDRDEDERLNPYLSNGYTLKKPRVEKRTLGETPPNRSRPTKRVQPDVTQGDDSRVGNLPISDGAGTGVPDFKPSGELEPKVDGGPLNILRQTRTPPLQSNVGKGDSERQKPGLLTRFRTNWGKGRPKGDSSKLAETPISGETAEPRKGMASWLRSWRASPTEKESLRLDQEALEEEQRAFERRVKKEEGNIEAGFAEIEKEAERVGALKDQRQSEIAESKRLQKKLQVELGEAEKLQKRYEDALKNVEQRETNLTERDEGLTAIHEQIQAQFGTVDSLREKIEEREMELNQLNSYISSLNLDKEFLERDNSTLERTRASLRKGIKSAQKAAKELQQKNRKGQELLEKQIGEKQREFDGLQADLGTIETLRNELAQSEDDGRERDEAHALEITRLTQKHSREADRWQIAKETFEQEIVQKSTEIKTLETKLAKKKERVKRLTGMISQLNSDLEESARKAAERDAEMIELEKSFVSWKDDFQFKLKREVRVSLDNAAEYERKIVNLFEDDFVTDFFPVLIYLKSMIGNKAGLLEDLFYIFFTEKEPGKFERVNDPETVLQRVEKRFDLDDPEIKKIEGKASWKRWVEKYAL